MTIDNALLCRMNLESFYVTIQLFVKSISKMLYRDKKSLCNVFYKRQRKIAVKTVSRIKTSFLYVKSISIQFFFLSFSLCNNQKISLWHQKIPQFITCCNMLFKSARIFLKEISLYTFYLSGFCFSTKKKDIFRE